AETNPCSGTKRDILSPLVSFESGPASAGRPTGFGIGATGAMGGAAAVGFGSGFGVWICSSQSSLPEFCLVTKPCPQPGIAHVLATKASGWTTDGGVALLALTI